MTKNGFIVLVVGISPFLFTCSTGNAVKVYTNNGTILSAKKIEHTENGFLLDGSKSIKFNEVDSFVTKDVNTVYDFPIFPFLIEKENEYYKITPNLYGTFLNGHNQYNFYPNSRFTHQIVLRSQNYIRKGIFSYSHGRLELEYSDGDTLSTFKLDKGLIQDTSTTNRFESFVLNKANPEKIENVKYEIQSGEIIVKEQFINVPSYIEFTNLNIIKDFTVIFSHPDYYPLKLNIDGGSNYFLTVYLKKREQLNAKGNRVESLQVQFIPGNSLLLNNSGKIDTLSFYPPCYMVSGVKVKSTDDGFSNKVLKWFGRFWSDLW